MDIGKKPAGKKNQNLAENEKKTETMTAHSQSDGTNEKKKAN